MILATTIFDFQPPSAATWFYFAVLLAIALFLKFSRLLSIRNLDVLTLPLLVPGLLLVRDSNGEEWYGYLWLLCGSAYLLFRCFLDLSLVTRPALSPNLSLGGLAWLAGALYVGLIAVAVRQPKEKPDPMAKAPAVMNRFQRESEVLLQQQTSVAGATQVDIPFWTARILALSCHLAVVLGLMFVGGFHFQDWHAGMAAATFYLLLPYTVLDVSQWHHVWPMALIMWAVFAYRIPTLSGSLLGLAAATTYFPLLLFPIWLSFYWRRGAGRFAGAFGFTGGLCLAVVVWTLWIDDDLARSVQSALSLPAWQPWRQPIHGTQGLWQDMHWAYRMPLFIAYLAMLGISALWPYPKNLAHLLALSAAAIIGVQFWYADQGGVYILWYLPLLLLLMFRPNLSESRPLPIQREMDWLTRLMHWVHRVVMRLLRGPESVAKVR
jgi:hypothetical protein